MIFNGKDVIRRYLRPSRVLNPVRRSGFGPPARQDNSEFALRDSI
jgi:hypothetical protein